MPMKTFAPLLGVAFLALTAPLPPAHAAARVLNVEFKFTPFVGDPTTQDEVTTVAGTADVFVNGIPVNRQEIGADAAPVLFEAREIAPAVWLPVESLGSILRHGANTLRIEFTPADPKAAYRAQLRWASVTDETTTSEGDGATTATNQAAEGAETREATGRLVMERAFDAPFAADRPWHHAPADTALTAADRTALRALVDGRIAAFAPDFAKLYALLAPAEGAPAGMTIDVAEVKRLECIDQVHAAGLRIAAAPAEEFEIVPSGHAEIVLRAKGGAPLYRPADLSVLAKITDEDVQICAGAALMKAFPPRLIVVRGAKGGWMTVE